jgi:hypothetical protein
MSRRRKEKGESEGRKRMKRRRKVKGESEKRKENE